MCSLIQTNLTQQGSPLRILTTDIRMHMCHSALDLETALVSRLKGEICRKIFILVFNSCKIQVNKERALLNAMHVLGQYHEMNSRT